MTERIGLISTAIIEKGGGQHKFKGLVVQVHPEVRGKENPELASYT